jgi:hypothetical protein
LFILGVQVRAEGTTKKRGLAAEDEHLLAATEASVAAIAASDGGAAAGGKRKREAERSTAPGQHVARGEGGESDTWRAVLGDPVGEARLRAAFEKAGLKVLGLDSIL